MARPNARRFDRNAPNAPSKICVTPKIRPYEMDNRAWCPSMDDRDRRRRGNLVALYVDCLHDRQEGQTEMNSLERVREELKKYEHPFFDFDAREKGEDVEMLIRSKIPNVLSPEYKITLNERD